MSLPETCGPITVLYQDDAIVVIDKPAAMLTHAHSFDRHSPTVVSVLGSSLGAAVFNVHRLDRMTTGVMVVARTREAAADLSRQFRERETAKHYIAIVRGHLDDEGTIETPIEHPEHGEEMHASTAYRTIERGRVDEPIGRYGEGWFSLVSLTLHTGRIHQARRHLHRINHPVLGDNKHGDKAYNRWVWNRIGERHLFLRARSLAFAHPVSGTQMTVTVGIPEVWISLLESVGIDAPVELRGDPTIRRG